MKRPLVVLATLVAVAFATVWFLKERPARDFRSISRRDAAEVERITAFWAAYNRGNTLRAQGEFVQAVPAFRRALELNPGHEDSLYYLGTSLFESGEYRQAAEEFRKILTVNPSSGRAWSELGNTLSIRAPGAILDAPAAQYAYQRSAELNREQAGPFLRLGLLELDRAHWDSAQANFRLAAGFGSPEGGYLLSYALFLEGHNREALPYLRKILDTYGQERKITCRGVLSEGDLLPGPGKPLTALDKSALKSIFLLNRIDTQQGARSAEVPIGLRALKRLRESSDFHALGAESGLKPGGGRAAWVDLDKDGRVGLVVAGSGRPVALYRNVGGRLSDVSAAAGLGGARDVWDAVWVDYDCDGYPDLYLIRPGYVGRGRNALFHNNHDGTFTDVTDRAGLAGERSTARACFADFSGSGRLDLLEVGTADSLHSSVRLYRNTGATFVEITRQAGLESTTTAVDCAVTDYDHDGKQDLFVLFWKQNAALYRNDGGARFSDATERAGLGQLHGTSFNALFFDYDNDGWEDLLVSVQAPYEEAVRCLLQPDFRAMKDTPRLFRNQRNGHFEEVTRAVGLERCYGTIQALAADLDADGWPDLLLVDGSLDGERLEPSLVLHNEHGRGFKEWFYLPDSDASSNFIGGSIANFGNNGGTYIYLARNPLLPGSLSSSSLFVNRSSASTLSGARVNR
jgi:tetratricopeptide (TPR) repeat protein